MPIGAGVGRHQVAFFAPRHCDVAGCGHRVSLTTAASYAISGFVDWPLALLVIAGGVIGSLAGTKANANVPVTNARSLSCSRLLWQIQVGVDIAAQRNAPPLLIAAITALAAAFCDKIGPSRWGTDGRFQASPKAGVA